MFTCVYLCYGVKGLFIYCVSQIWGSPSSPLITISNGQHLPDSPRQPWSAFVYHSVCVFNEDSSSFGCTAGLIQAQNIQMSSYWSYYKANTSFNHPLCSQWALLSPTLTLLLHHIVDLIDDPGCPPVDLLVHHHPHLICHLVDLFAN